MAEATTGRRMLGEIEEASLDEILTDLRTSLNPTSPINNQTAAASISSAAPVTNHAPTAHRAGNAPFPAKVKSYPIPHLDALVTRHLRATQSAPLTLAGRHLPLIYLLVATLIAEPHHKAVVVIDFDARFDITRVLQCIPYAASVAADSTQPAPHARPLDQAEAVPSQIPTSLPEPHSEHDAAARPGSRVSMDDLKHVHIYRPARGSSSHARDILTSVEHHMVYSKHASVAREWWGTIVIGGGSPAALGHGCADITTGWRGWLRVDRETIRAFPTGISIEEALIERDQRQRAVEKAGYAATCVWGGLVFREGSCD